MITVGLLIKDGQPFMFDVAIDEYCKQGAEPTIITIDPTKPLWLWRNGTEFFFSQEGYEGGAGEEAWRLQWVPSVDQAQRHCRRVGIKGEVIRCEVAEEVEPFGGFVTIRMRMKDEKVHGHPVAWMDEYGMLK